MVLVPLGSFYENVIASIAALHRQGGRRTHTLARLLAGRERSGLLQLAMVGDPVLKKRHRRLQPGKGYSHFNSKLNWKHMCTLHIKIRDLNWTYHIT